MNSEIGFYWELIKKRMPVMVVIFVLCTGVGVGLALTMPPRYEASAALVVEGAALPDSLFTSTVQSESVRELQAIELRLMTRANLIDIATKYRIFEDSSDISPDTIVDVMRASTGFSLTPGGREEATVLEISFASADAQTAADVVNEYVTYVLRADAERRRDDSGQTLEFFKNRVEALSRRLSEQSAEIVSYKEANNDALPEGLQFRLDRQSQLQERLNLNARDRNALVEQRNRIVAAGSEGSALGGALSPQQQEINRLETELRSKLAIYEPDSATIQFLQRRIDLLRASELPGEAALDGLQSMLELQLAGVDAEIRSLDQDTESIEAELEVLRRAIERTPQVAIRLDELEREYENTQTQYNEAVRARSTAEQGVDVETSAKGERVVLIEQAAVPRWPTSPNRKLIAGGGVFVGTALASVFFILTELLNSAIRRPADLTRGLGVQPLATIPFFEEASVRRRRRVVKVAFILFVMISIPFALWAIHTYYLPLDLLFEMILEKVGL